MTVLTSTPFIERPPRDLAGWAACFAPGELPVLASTAEDLTELGRDIDAVDAHTLGDVISVDPLMTIKLFAHVGDLRRGRLGGNPETVIEALVLLGIPPFFRAFGSSTTVEQQLAGVPGALEGFGAVLRRARRAANFAIAFAVHRMDHDAPVIHEAALLHDFVELLLWWRAPALAAEIAARQARDRALRSADAQLAVLNVTLADLQHRLLAAWHLPELLVRITDKNRVHDRKVDNVMLAIRLARHSAHGWDDAAIPDDVRDIAELLNLGQDPTLRLLERIDGA